MNKSQAYQIGYKAGLRSIKEETTDYTEDQVNAILQKLRQDFEKTDDLVHQALTAAQEMDQDYANIRKILANAPGAEDKDSPNHQLFSDIWDAINFVMNTFGSKSIWTTRLTDLIENNAKDLDKGLSKLGV